MVISVEDISKDFEIDKTKVNIYVSHGRTDFDAEGNITVNYTRYEFK